MCRRIEKWRNLHICQDIGLILLELGAGGGYFWILNPKSTIKFLCDIILTSKWRKGKIPIYRLHKMHMTSLWRHVLSNFFENFNLSPSYEDYHCTKFGLIWVKESKVTEGAPPRPPPGWECIKSPRWDMVKTVLHLLDNDSKWIDFGVSVTVPPSCKIQLAWRMKDLKHWYLQHNKGLHNLFNTNNSKLENKLFSFSAKEIFHRYFTFFQPLLLAWLSSQF